MAALRSVREERGVAHAERVESLLSEKRSVLFVSCRLKSVAEEVEGDVRVECGGAGRAAETLVGEPAPAGGVVGEGEVRRAASRSAQFTREAGGVCRKIG